MLGSSLGSTYGKVTISEECIKLRLFDAKVLDTIFGNVDGTTLLFGVGTELGYVDGSFDGSNDVKLEDLLI